MSPVPWILAWAPQGMSFLVRHRAVNPDEEPDELAREALCGVFGTTSEDPPHAKVNGVCEKCESIHHMQQSAETFKGIRAKKLAAWARWKEENL